MPHASPNRLPLQRKSRSRLALGAGFAAVLLLALQAAPAAAAEPAAGSAPRKALTEIAPEAQCPRLLQQSFPRLQDEKPQSLCQYSGKVLLVVNTASFCGFTPQYEGLEKLHARFADRGLVVLGFPSNDFGRQEPGGGKTIADFCASTYGVKFPLFGKSVVSGPQANPLYLALAKATGKAPAWNFHKYLIGRNGAVLASFDSALAPGSPVLVKAVEQALASTR